MAKILLANQWGGGLGHAKRLRLLADLLASRGHGVALALPDLPAVSSLLADVSYPIIQGPVWRGNLQPRKATRSFADIMANQAFADPAHLSTLADAWGRLLDLVRPDLAIADFAPLLCLAVRGRLPLAVAGIGFCVPPGDQATFPVLWERAPEGISEGRLLENANDWLISRRRPPLPSLPAIHPVEHSYPQGLEELDPYREWRRLRPSRPLMQSILPPSPVPETTTELSIFAYVSCRHPLAVPLLAALARTGARIEAYLRNGNPEALARLRAAGVAVHERPVVIAEALKRSHAILHHANGGTSQEALTAGRPQICLPLDAEKRLVGRMLKRLGVAMLVEFPELATARNLSFGAERALAGNVRAFCLDAAVNERVRQVAAEFASRQFRDPLPPMVEEMEELARSA